MSISTEEMRLALARRLREAREYVGLSQDEVAEALNISRPGVTHLESGQRKVESTELQKLSTLYGRTVDYLLNGVELAAESQVAFLARALHGLSANDMEELSRFAKFLRNVPTEKT
jgi:transcriptional regulator with XRE-family HTH domain